MSGTEKGRRCYQAKNTFFLELLPNAIVSKGQVLHASSAPDTARPGAKLPRCATMPGTKLVSGGTRSWKSQVCSASSRREGPQVPSSLSCASAAALSELTWLSRSQAPQRRCRSRSRAT
eukprot:1832424-Rhodomonas_salina.1